MRNSLKGIKSLQLVEALLGVAWLIITLVCISYETAGTVTWVCLVFGIIAFVLVEAVIFFFLRVYNFDAAEVSAVPFYFSGIYLLIAVAVNTAFPIIHTVIEEVEHSEVFWKIPLIINVGVLMAYVIALVLAYTYVMRVERSMTESLERKSLYNDIIASLSSLKDIVQDAEVKSEVDKLHELVAYSSNVTKETAWEIEDRILVQLNELSKMAVNNESPELMKNKMQEVNILWKKRNRC